MVSFENLDREVDQIEELLKNKYGIVIAPGSLLERSCLEVRADLERRRRANANPQDIDLALDFRGPGREVAGLAMFLDHLLRAEQRGGIPAAIVPHLRLLNDSMVSQAVPYGELMISETQKQATDKVFELIVALAAAEVGEDLEMDDPRNSSRGENPDILITIDGERWGFACKVPNPQQPEESKRMRTVVSNVQAGMEQIRRSPASKGQVIVNLRNLFDHNMLNPVQPYTEGMTERLFAAFDLDSIDQIVLNWFRDFAERFRKENGTSDLLPLLCDPKVGYGFIGYLETAASVKMKEEFVPTPMRFFVPIGFGNVVYPIEGSIKKLRQALNGPESRSIPEDILIPNFVTVR